MTSYLLYDIDGSIKGKIVLPIQRQQYTDMQIKQAFQKRCRDNIIITFWVNAGGISDIAIKIHCHSLISTVLKSCCDRYGVNTHNYSLKHGATILPEYKQVGFFIDNNDIIQLVQNSAV
jgi:hypothetical protein